MDRRQFIGICSEAEREASFGCSNESNVAELRYLLALLQQVDDPIMVPGALNDINRVRLLSSLVRQQRVQDGQTRSGWQWIKGMPEVVGWIEWRENWAMNNGALPQEAFFWQETQFGTLGGNQQNTIRSGENWTVDEWALWK